MEIEIRIKGKLGKSSDLQGWVLDTEVLKVLIRKVTFFRIFSETAWKQVERHQIPGDWSGKCCSNLAT